MCSHSSNKGINKCSKGTNNNNQCNNNTNNPSNSNINNPSNSNINNKSLCNSNMVKILSNNSNIFRLINDARLVINVVSAKAPIATNAKTRLIIVIWRWWISTIVITTIRAAIEAIDAIKAIDAIINVITILLIIR